VLRVLGHYCGVERHRITLDGAAFEVPGAADLSLPRLPAVEQGGAVLAAPRIAGARRQHRHADQRPRSGRSAFYAPGLGEITPALFDLMCGADAVLVDGTFWTDDEMIRLGLSKKTARDIGHLPQQRRRRHDRVAGQAARITRRLLIHINNTNPILDEDSPEARALKRAGIEVCEDGMDPRALTCAATDPPGAAIQFEAKLRERGRYTTSTTRSTSC
jgi:pyrroloquinoline quinone biosynthesis protein B